MGRVLDFLGGLKPKSPLVGIVSEKKDDLRAIIKQLEEITKVEFPPLYVYHALFIDESSDGIDNAIIFHRKSGLSEDNYEHVIYLSAFALTHYDRETLTGILIEEFLHYIYRLRQVIEGKPVGGQPDKQMLEPVGEWFPSEYFTECFEKAQSPLKGVSRWVRDWSSRKYPVISSADIHSEKGNLMFNVPTDVILGLRARGKLQGKRQAIP